MEQPATACPNLSCDISGVGVEVYCHGNEYWSYYRQHRSQCRLRAQLSKPHPPCRWTLARGRGCVLEDVIWLLGSSVLAKLWVGLDQGTGDTIITNMETRHLFPPPLLSPSLPHFFPLSSLSTFTHLRFNKWFSFFASRS